MKGTVRSAALFFAFALFQTTTKAQATSSGLTDQTADSVLGLIRAPEDLQKMRLFLPAGLSNRQSDSLQKLITVYYRSTGKDMPAYVASAVAFANAYWKTLPSGTLNQFAWELFRLGTKRSDLKDALIWSKRSVETSDPEGKAARLDTYANLLYKIGNVNEAVQAQKEVIRIAPADFQLTDLIGTLKKFLANKPTWPSLRNPKSRAPNKVFNYPDTESWQIIRDLLPPAIPARRADSIMLVAKYKYEKSAGLKEQYARSIYQWFNEFKLSPSMNDRNWLAWELYLSTDDRELLRIAFTNSEVTVKEGEQRMLHYYYDTYAHILYKIGDKKQALLFERKAIEAAPDDKSKKEYEIELNKMLDDTLGKVQTN